MEKDRQTDEQLKFVWAQRKRERVTERERENENVKVKMNGDNKLFENWNLQNST